MAGLIYDIKSIADPLIDGLHSSFVGLDKATIDRVIPVRDEIPISFTLPLNQDTIVVLTNPVPLQANAQFFLPGGGGSINGTVSLDLPVGMELPVTLNLDVPVNAIIPISLDVRAVIPLEETQLHDPLENLRSLLQPFVYALDNLPDNPDQGQMFLNQLVDGVLGRGPMPYLLTPTDEGLYPWPGYSITAGDGYVWPQDTPPQPGQFTGIVPEGLAEWSAVPGAAGGQNGIYIPYGEVGPAGIIPAGNPWTLPQYGIGGRIPGAQPQGQGGGTTSDTTPGTDMGIITPAPSAPTEEPAAAPPGADIGIITPTPEP